MLSKMSRTNGGREVTLQDSNEGTAARTRPINLEEILARRKKNLNSGDKGLGDIRESSEQNDDGIVSERGHDLKDSKDAMKADSKKLEEAQYRREHKYVESNDKGYHDPKSKTKLESNYSKSNRESKDKESKNEKHIHHRSRTSDQPVADSEKEPEKKQAVVSTETDKYDDLEREAGMERKRKHESRIDDKSRSGIDDCVPKKHDSGKLRDAEYSERKDQKKEHSRIHHDEPKRRRSRSREYDQERRRSDSMLASRIDDKNKPMIYSSNLKRHDTGKPRYAEYSERKDQKKQQSRTHHEEQTKRRSRSREYDQERVRSDLMLPSHSDHRSRPIIDSSNAKKHDSGKLRYAEYSERNDRQKELSRAHHEEPKRRRSRSQEYNKERDRSDSLLPTHTDDKNRSVLDSSISKKHDSGKSHDAEYSERNDRKKEHSRTDHDEPRRRRSRSRDYAQDRDRSDSMLLSHIDDKNKPVIDSSIPKKHDSGNSHDTKYSEKDDHKLEHSRTHNEEQKWRRSRSHEYDQEKDGPGSMSPRAHKHSDKERDYDKPVFKSSNDKSRRKYSEDDKFRTSENGGYGGRNHRKHGSGLGGYSPRKRRPDSTVKSPPPTKAKSSPEKKTSTWDQPPAGTCHGGSGSVFANFQPLSSTKLELISSAAVTPSVTKPQPSPSVDAASMLKIVSVDSVQLTQATRPMRRLYIENLPPSASEKSVINCLNDFLLSSGANHIQGAKPCISCIINKDKCQAVVEFLTPEDATAAICFDGRSLWGSVLKIRRPKEFVETATGAPEKSVPVVKTISEAVKDSPHKIFIGGISKALSSDMLLEIVGAFGRLRAYHFEFNEELNRPCAFLEYEDHSITQKACAGLNGMKLGGRVLTAVQDFLGSQGDEDDAETLPSYNVPSHTKSLLSESTQVLQLNNVFNPEEFRLLSDSELEETLDDIRLECTRFGTIKSINIVKFDNKCEGASEVSERQDPHSDSTKTQSSVNSPSHNCQNETVDVDVPTLNNEKEVQNISEDTKSANGDHENPVEDYGIVEDFGVEENPMEDKRKKENSSVGEDLDSEIPSHEVDITKGNTATLKANVGNAGDNLQIVVEASNPNIFTANEGKVSNIDSSHQSEELGNFDVGCVLVEFLREEAACAAAHCLHRRYYGDRIVSAGYVPHDLYLTRFPK